MQVAVAVVGAILVILALVDAVKTTLAPDSDGGPLTRRIVAGTWRLLIRVRPDGRSGLLAAGGPIALLLTISVWVVLQWAGWTLVFSGSDGAVRVSATSAPADLAARVYFAGFVIFTLGVGDVVPGDGLWQVLTAVASFLGLFLITLSITYVISVVSAAVNRRRLAQNVMGLGGRGHEVVALYWDGDRLDWQLAVQVMSLSDELIQTTQQHLAYPVLYAFHARKPESSAPRTVAVLDDAYVLLADGLAPQIRPSAAVLQPLRSALAQYAVTVASTASGEPSGPPRPALGPLRAAGIPVVDDESFEAALDKHNDRRGQLHALVQNDGWSWPDQA